MRKSFLVAGVAALSLGVTGVAVAQNPAPTIDATATVSPTKAGSKSKPKSEKLKLSLKTNAEAKATAGKIAITLPSTLKLSTTGLTQCKKSDAEIINTDSAVCKSSVAGKGEANAQITSNGSPINFEVTPLVGKNEVLFYLHQVIKTAGQPDRYGSVEAVLHGKVKGRTMTIEIPKFLQSPAQGTYSALVSLETTLSKKKGSKALLTSTGCKSRAHKVGVKVSFEPNPNPPAGSGTASDTASAKCS